MTDKMKLTSTYYLKVHLSFQGAIIRVIVCTELLERRDLNGNWNHVGDIFLGSRRRYLNIIYISKSLCNIVICLYFIVVVVAPI